MKKSILVVVAAAVLFIGSPSVYAVLVTIEADNFSTGTNISNAFDYITLSASNGSSIYSVASTNVGGELGANVMGLGLDENWRFGPYNDHDYLGEYLNIEIDGFATRISAWYTATDESGLNNGVMMLGFDSDGEQFTISVGQQIGWGHEFAGVVVGTGVSRPITRVTVGLISGWAVSIDHIVIDFTPVPEPSTLLLLGLGVPILSGLRKRKR